MLNPVGKVRTFFKKLGPGLVTGASDDDPSGIATYSQAGAQAGFGFLWTALLTFPLMAGVQEMCARIGLVTGRGLVGNLKEYYPRPVLYFLALLVLTANTINIGADIAGMSAAASLLVPLPPFVWVITFSLLVLGAMILLPYYRFAGILKWLTLGLLAYIFVPFITRVNWPEALAATAWPTLVLDKAGILILVAILGTTISPYLFFWQANMEVEDEKSKKKSSHRMVVTKHEIRWMREDVTFGMFLSNIVMWFIILSTASTLFVAGITEIRSAEQAAQALRPFAGENAYLLFTLGIVGTGLLAIPVLAGSASYVLAEIFGWREGFDNQFNQAKQFYIVIIAATFIGAGLSILGLDPITLLIATAVVYGLIAPPLILSILLLANSRKIMGENRNGHLSNALVGLTLVVMTAAAGAFVYFNLFS